MIPELSEEPNKLLASVKAAKGEGGRLTLVDLITVTRELRGQHKEQMGRLIRGARISKADAGNRFARLSEFYRYVGEIAEGSRTQLEGLRAELEKRPEKIYLPK